MVMMQLNGVCLDLIFSNFKGLVISQFLKHMIKGCVPTRLWVNDGILTSYETSNYVLQKQSCEMFVKTCSKKFH